MTRWMPLAALLVAAPAQAEVTRLEIVSVDRPAFQGRTFGERGAAENITTPATIAVDPSELWIASTG